MSGERGDVDVNGPREVRPGGRGLGSSDTGSLVVGSLLIWSNIHAVLETAKVKGRAHTAPSTRTRFKVFLFKISPAPGSWQPSVERQSSGSFPSGSAEHLRRHLSI